MNIHASRLLFFFFFITILAGQSPTKKLTLEDMYIHHSYDAPEYSVGPWLKDDTAFLFIYPARYGMWIMRHEISSGDESVFLNAEQLKVDGSGEQVTVGSGRDAPDERSFSLSPDERWVLLAGEERVIWRRSRVAKYFIHDRKTGLSRRLTLNNSPQSNATFSPDSRMVAYVMKNDLYVTDLATGSTRQLTKDGSEAIINGRTDWLYEEEFSFTRAYEWSPDSRFILYLRFNQGHMRTYPLIDEMQQYPRQTTVRYPKVGERNSLVQVGVVDVKRGRTRWMDAGPETDIYIPRIYWTGRENQVAYYRLDRKQQQLELILANARSVATSVAATQKDTAWVDVTDDLHFINGGSRILWTDESSGYRHIYVKNLDDHSTQSVTTGEWEVTEIVGVDENNQAVFFLGKKDGIHQQHVYRVGFDGTDPECLSPSGGWNTIHAAPEFTHYILERSSYREDTQFSLYKSSGQKVRQLGEGAPAVLGDLDIPPPEFFTMTTTDRVDLSAVIQKPKDFNPSRKYPTLIYVYGGPGSQAVRDRWGGSRGLWHHYLAQEGYIVLSVDNRGTGGRGETFQNLSYGDMGKWALHDQIETAKWAASQSWGDAERIAIWGWSFGGYTTSLCLTAESEYFNCGIAVAPVIDFRLYDTAWTERYMGLLHENEAGYLATNVLSYVDGYMGGLMLVHGTSDDNVHPQHTWQFMNQLINRGQFFDLMMYPGKNHSLPGATYHLYHEMTSFIRENL
ncbi:S9 family peptidase [Candidatus Neomarinimicrobiota bacterium]